MNFGELKRIFNRYLPAADDAGLTWLLILGIIIILVLVIASGKKINLRLPFMPRALGGVSVSKDSLAGLKGKAGAVKAPRFKMLIPGVSLIKGLVNAVQLLSGGQEDRYKVPTYLLLSGDNNQDDNFAGAVKDKAMLNSISEMLGKKEQLVLKDAIENYTERSWYMFKKGCVVHHQDDARVVAELRQYRPERPLDGIIVTLPVSKLQQSDDGDLARWATRIYQRIWKTQKKIGFILPVYVLVTETETLPGFSRFWQQNALKDFRQQQFGWANPNDVTATYTPLWITQAIAGLGKAVRSTQLIMMGQNKQGSVEDNHTDALLLANSIETLEDRLHMLCDELFSSAALQNPLMLRGIYFTGQQPSEADSDVSEHLFLRDLFVDKIFLEDKLARAPKNRLLSSNNRLRTYQYVSVAAFVALSALLIRDTATLYQQSRSLVHSIEGLPKAQSPVDAQHVKDILNHVAHMDASTINYPSMPLSWNTPFDDRLTTYFSKTIFQEEVFPAFECSMQDKLKENLLLGKSKVKPQEYLVWLETLAQNLSEKQRLEKLVRDDLGDMSEGQILSLVTELFQYLHAAELPASFYSRSSLYVAAIARESQTTLHNTYCDLEPLNTEESWHKMTAMADRQIPVIADRAVAPQAFFTISQQLLSLPNVVSKYQEMPNIGPALDDFNQWQKYLADHWLTSHTERNSCESIYTAMHAISNLAFPEQAGYAKQFLDRCYAAVERVMIEDNQTLNFPLYQRTAYPMSLSDEATNFFTAMNSATRLSYLETTSAPVPEEVVEDFFWSVESLNRALRHYEEYRDFARTEYSSLWLPKQKISDPDTYIAQGLNLKQLEFAMHNTVLGSRVQELKDYRPSELRPIDQEEAYLAAAVKNFEQSMSTIVALLSAYETLDFTTNKQWLLDTTQQQAVKLLQRVDRLYNDNRLYEPNDRVQWSAHSYEEALFGFDSEGKIQDYLAAQRERVSAIAQNYAEPVVVFLLNTKGKHLAPELFGRWNKTLIEINRSQNAGTATTLAALEHFMLNDITGIDQSNCFYTTKQLQEPQGSDVFSLGQKRIILKASEHCNSYRADKIKQRYVEVAELFEAQLADKAPFNRSPIARNVSPQEMRTFIADYQPLAEGLAQRMKVLAWKHKKYQQAQEFVQSLDAITAIYGSIIGTANSKDSLGIEIEAQFNVMDNLAKLTRHVSDWQLISGSYQSNYLGQSQPVYWKPGDPIAMNLNWAEQSPYRAYPVDGSAQGNVLQYEIADIWGLLRFINKYQAEEVDSESLNNQSALLKFEARVRDLNDVDPDQPVMRTFVRLILYGIDPETNQRLALQIPDYYPETAPIVNNSKRGQP